MPKGKQKSKSATTDGQHRRETKEERRERLQHQAEARDRCFQLLPYAGGVMLLFLVAFALWVRSVPPAPVPEKKPPTTTTTTTTTPQFDLDALKNLDPETLAKAGLTLEDLEKMTATFTTDDLHQQQQQPPQQPQQDQDQEKASWADGDEEISLDEPEADPEKTAAMTEDGAAAGEASPEKPGAQEEEAPPSDDRSRKDDEL